MPKYVDGQISFADPSYGYSMPGLIEHGSYVTGQPDLLYYGRDPYRGVYGLGHTRLKGNWCGTRADPRWTGIPNYLEYDPAPYRGMLGNAAFCKRVYRNGTWHRVCVGSDAGRPAAISRRIAPTPHMKPMPKRSVSPRGRQKGMGNLLTDLTCSQSQFAQDWRNRFGEVMSTTLYVAIGAAAAAGLIGAITKKPLVGVVAGAVVGWMAHQSQLATYAEFLPASR